MSGNDEDFDLFGDSEPTKRVVQIKTLPLSTIEGRRQQFVLSKSFQFDTFPAFSVEECEEILKDLNFDSDSRHSSFKTTDTSLYSHPQHQFILDGVRRILGQFEKVTGFKEGDLELLDCFFVRYDDHQRSLEPHTDGCLLSFNVQLNSLNEFQGGGTRFTELSKTFKIPQGHCIMHSAKLLHEGVAVTSGTRIILVGFVETKRQGKYSKKELFRRDLNMRRIN
jgi:hypothetical protein